jgi:hypothetical protein
MYTLIIFLMKRCAKVPAIRIGADTVVGWTADGLSKRLAHLALRPEGSWTICPSKTVGQFSDWS